MVLILIFVYANKMNVEYGKEEIEINLYERF